MQLLGIIPARGGSKGVPRKNIKLLKGRPLINYTIQTAKESKLLTEFIVSTDDNEIAEVSRSAGAWVPFIRPSHLAKDTTPTVPVIKHAIEYMESVNKNFDAICILQPTSPFRPNGLLDKCIEKFISMEAETLISVKKVPDHYNPHWVFEEDDKGISRISTGEKKIIPRRQLLPDTFYRDGMFYIVRTDVLLKGESLFGERVVNYKSEGLNINIDSKEDWEKAEVYLDKGVYIE